MTRSIAVPAADTANARLTCICAENSLPISLDIHSESASAFPENAGCHVKKCGKRQKWEEMSIQEHMDYYMDQGIQKKEAMKMVAKDRGVGKRDIYQALL